MSMFSKSKPMEPVNTAAAEMKKKPKRQNRMDRNLSCDEMDSDDLDGDLNLSDEEGGAATRSKIKQRSAPEAKKDRQQYAIEFDTNVFKVALECLQNKGQYATGDAEFCAECKGVFNKFSTTVEEGGQ